MNYEKVSIGIAAALLLTTCFSFSQEPQNQTPPAADDLHNIRALVERQSMQIDALCEQVKRLTHLIESSQPPLAAPVATPAAQPQPSPQQEAVPVAPAVAAVPAQPDGAATHVVSKGETLTSIAKHYKVSIADLIKLNKIENDRKLQIGQTLTIPTPKTSEAREEKKENQ